MGLLFFCLSAIILSPNRPAGRFVHKAKTASYLYEAVCDVMIKLFYKRLIIKQWIPGPEAPQKNLFYQEKY